MITATHSEKRERTTAELFIVAVLLGCFMTLFIGYYFNQQTKVLTAGFQTLAQHFKNTTVIVHAQWLMDKQPPVVKLLSLNSTAKVNITVNTKGWLDIGKTTALDYGNSACESIWKLAMNIPMSLMKNSIEAIEIHDERWPEYHKCRYLLSTGEYFEYTSVTGEVTQVQVKNG